MSRHRFDHSVDHNDDTKEVSAPVRLRRIEMITGAERRRKWSAEEKAEIVAESLAEGTVVSEVARRHGLSPQQLFGWRARLRAAVKSSAPSSDVTPSFVPAIVENEPLSPAAPALPAAVTAIAERIAIVELANAKLEHIRNGTAGRVRVVLHRILRGDEPQLARVAEELGMSMRTLQRRLSAEGARFADLLDDVRH